MGYVERMKQTNSKTKTASDCGDNKVIFRYDEPVFFVGYSAFETWNGWDCVKVEKETFDKLRKVCEESGSDTEDYDNAEADEFGLYSLDGHCSQICGFDYNGVFVTNPFKTDCGRFEVDPLEHYKLTHEELVNIFGENYKSLKC